MILQDVSPLDQHSFVMTMELCERNLKSFITSNVYKENGLYLRKRMCIEFLTGLNVLHANNIVHGNIKVNGALCLLVT